MDDASARAGGFAVVGRWTSTSSTCARLAIHVDLLLEAIAVQDSAVGGPRLISCARGRKLF
jgi:hypothetical protein